MPLDYLAFHYSIMTKYIIVTVQSSSAMRTTGVWT